MNRIYHLFIQYLKDILLKDGKKLSGSWYYYKQHDKQTGWQKIDDTWYYLDASGKMLTDWQK